jgi:phage terminase large subunit GpA-like protein
MTALRQLRSNSWIRRMMWRKRRRRRNEAIRGDIMIVF